MTYYFQIQNDKIIGKSQAKCLNEDIFNIVVDEDVYNEAEKYIAIPHEYEVEVQDYETIYEEQEMPIYDENGEIVSYETITVEKQVEAGTHTEIRVYYTIELNPNYEAEQAQKEAERVSKLTCTKRVFALMLQELGITYTMLKQLIATNEQAQLEWDLCVELQRSNPLLDVMASQLGVTSEQLDGLFRYANGEITIEEFRALYVKTDEELPTDEIVEQEGNTEVEND